MSYGFVKDSQLGMGTATIGIVCRSLRHGHAVMVANWVSSNNINFLPVPVTRDIQQMKPMSLKMVLRIVLTN